MHRISLIIKLREARKTYKEIGEILSITQQRVHQIYKGYTTTPRAYIIQAKARDNNMCCVCNTTKNLEVHHANGLRRDNNLENLVTLCRKCHHEAEKVLRESKPKRIAFKKPPPRKIPEFTWFGTKSKRWKELKAK